ncbi:hypothetical protein Phum_PHUM250950 [Pediculus humanus corporis]|uniref:Uncharacterized protein n=1 Tax=Pediculus humanus subsp. corporis TaxID=121224 RepID=E0VJU7_PEDHC|nr:uncharacterized protein Phum_PHUM250950 [Pediculus humanus corporis]EEB13653.1 hypothetical protein Phum_PHUM250950 [Pediculus humanus corporis]
MVINVINGIPIEQTNDFQDSILNKTNCNVILLAPAETVLQVAQLANLDNEIENINKPSSQLRPKPRPPSPKISNDDESSKKTETEMKNPLSYFSIFPLLLLFTRVSSVNINKGNLPENFQPGENIESFSALFQLAKLNIIARMMSKEIQILLPSDQSWRLKNYFKLLNKQKEKTLELRM